MSSTKHIETINNLLKASYRRPNRPPQGVHKISQLSQIPKLIDFIREHKYGPLLQIGADPDLVSTEFKAQFTKGKMKYAEQLLITGKNYANYKTIFDLIDQLKIGRAVADLTETEKKVTELLDFTKKLREEEYQQLDELVSGSNLLFQDQREKERAFAEIEREVHASRMRQTGILQNSLEQLYHSVLPDVKNQDQRELMNKIVVIWFLAEGFRYPLMLLYSMIAFHNIVNGYAVDREGKIHREHFSKNPGSQPIQLMCFERYFDSETGPLSRTEESEMKALNESFFKVLKIMYDGICNHPTRVQIHEIDTVEHQYSIRCFKECFKHYIKLSGAEKVISDVDLDQLVDYLEKMEHPFKENLKTVDELISDLISVLNLRSSS